MRLSFLGFIIQCKLETSTWATGFITRNFCTQIRSRHYNIFNNVNPERCTELSMGGSDSRVAGFTDAITFADLNCTIDFNNTNSRYYQDYCKKVALLFYKLLKPDPIRN